MKLYVTKFASYQPSPENPAEKPSLAYCDPLFKRRLSQISRMTIEVIHELGSEVSDSKLVFVSFRGEISRQLKINQSLVEDAEVLPAQFSISTFNTPPAATTIALGMKAGYTAIYPSEDDFYSALVAASASILSGAEKSVIFSYADELVPEEYKDCAGYTSESPLAFACVLASEKAENSIEIDLQKKEFSEITPSKFLDYLKKAAPAV